MGGHLHSRSVPACSSGLVKDGKEAAAMYDEAAALQKSARDILQGLRRFLQGERSRLIQRLEESTRPLGLFLRPHTINEFLYVNVKFLVRSREICDMMQPHSRTGLPDASHNHFRNSSHQFL